MFDITQVEKDARAELAEEQSKCAKVKIKAKMKDIAAAEAILANLRNEYDVLLRDIGTTVG